MSNGWTDSIRHEWRHNRLLQFDSTWYNIFLNPEAATHAEQNTVVPVVSGTRRSQHIKLNLVELHWLPITYHIQYKLALTTFKILTSWEPCHFAELVHTYQQPRSLRLRGTNILCIDVPGLSFTNCDFCHAAPSIRNCLSQSVTSYLWPSLATFKRRLKTALYCTAFTTSFTWLSPHLRFFILPCPI